MRLLVLILCLLHVGFLFAQNKISVLGIGNSYTEDLFWRVPELLDQDTSRVELAFLYVPGGALSDHLSLIKSDRPSYTRYTYDGTQKQWLADTIRYSDVTSARPWDVVIIQQCSQFAGNYSNIDHYLPQLLKRLQGDFPGTQLYWHLVWAYPQGSDHPGFAQYDYSQSRMFHDLVSASFKIMKGKYSDSFAGLVPTGALIQYLRDSTEVRTEGDFCRDNQHLEHYLSRYAAACCLYESVLSPRLGPDILDLDSSVLGDSLHTETDYELIRQEAQRLVQSPDLIWNMLADEHIYKSLFYEIRGPQLGSSPGRLPYIRQDFFDSGRVQAQTIIQKP